MTTQTQRVLLLPVSSRASVKRALFVLHCSNTLYYTVIHDQSNLPHVAFPCCRPVIWGQVRRNEALI